MKNIAFFCAAMIHATCALGGERAASKFAFQDVPLNAHFADLDSRWLKDCVRAQDPRRDFCLAKSTAGEIALTVEVGFLDGYVNTIYVSFPRGEYITMLAALRVKNGKEDVTTETTARWWSHSPGGTSGFPDSIVIRQAIETKPKPDGMHWMPGIEYSEITYSSSWTINNPLDSLDPEQKRKIQETSRGL